MLYSVPVALCHFILFGGFFCLFLFGDEDCNPGWGDCGRPLRLCVCFVCLTEDCDLANDFLFIGDWTIRSASLSGIPATHASISVR